MSIPIFADDGCIIAETFCRTDSVPWYLRIGNVRHETINKCPTRIHASTHTEVEILFPFSDKIAGYAKSNSMASGIYLTISEHKNRKWFFAHDVYCKECQSWHFK